jgi:hypothetical protein
MKNEISFGEFIKTLGRGRQNLWISVLTGLVTTYAAYIPVNVFGMWTNNWTFMLDNLIYFSIWSLLTYLGIRFKFGLGFLVLPLVLVLCLLVPPGMNAAKGLWTFLWPGLLYILSGMTITSITILCVKRSLR